MTKNRISQILRIDKRNLLSLNNRTIKQKGRWGGMKSKPQEPMKLFIYNNKSIFYCLCHWHPRMTRRKND